MKIQIEDRKKNAVANDDQCAICEWNQEQRHANDDPVTVIFADYDEERDGFKIPEPPFYGPDLINGLIRKKMALEQGKDAFLMSKNNRIQKETWEHGIVSRYDDSIKKVIGEINEFNEEGAQHD